MKLLQPPQREYRTFFEDSRRWSVFDPRPGDVVISTYPKCGTTWTQRIVAALIFATPEPLPLYDLSPWIDRRNLLTPDELKAVLDGQMHRRFIKSHIPFDGLPIHDQVRYIHVARDGRDAAISWHNHASGMRPEIYEAVDASALADETIARPMPRPLPDPADEFHRWLTEAVIPGQTDGLPNSSYFHFEAAWWAERERENVLMLHYNDMTADLAGEVARIAAFLGIDLAPDLMAAIVEASTFAAMKRDGKTLVPRFEKTFEGGTDRFLHKGTNRRWQGVFRDADLALYDAKMAALPEGCADWLRHGWRGASARAPGKD